MPTHVPAFVGRESELHQGRELQARARMLTLVGPGGIGKSRLARELALSLVRDFERGARVVDLDTVPTVDGIGIWSAVAHELAITPAQPQHILRQLALQHVLLVLDNCDGALGESAQLAADLLATCVGVSVLATAREPLRIAGEVVWEVPPLRLPPAEWSDLADLLANDAIRLFVTRLRGMQPEFELTEENAHVLVGICRQLDPLPQLVQTAATRAHLEGLAQLSARLSPEYVLDMPDTARKLPRHRTLRASLDWGTSVLDEPDRLLLARLSVFAGGWTAAAAEAVCADAALPRERIGPGLSRLTARSLVLLDQSTQPPRYRMTDVTRQYARGAISSDEAWGALERGRAEYLVGNAMPEAANDDSEYDNVLAALDWALGMPAADLAFGLAEMAYALWRRRGVVKDARVWLGRVLDMSAPDRCSESRQRVTHLAAYMAVLDADVTAARGLLQEARSEASLSWRLLIALSSGDAEAASELLHQATEQADCALRVACARAALELGDTQRAAQLASRAVAQARLTDDRFWLARAVHAQALVALHTRQPANARWLVQRCMSLQTIETDPDGLVDSLCVLGHAELGLGAPSSAIQAFMQAFSLARRSGLRLAQLNASEGLACASAAAHPDAAMRLVGACGALRRRTGAGWWLGERRRISMWLQRGLGRRIDVDALAEGTPEDAGAWDEIAELIDSFPAAPMTEPGHTQDALTTREREVAELLARGLSNRQIASRLAISVGTVRAHVEHILLKLGVHSRAQVASWALREHRRPA